MILGPVPGFPFVGNAAGCGKDLLIDLGSIIGRGCDAPSRTYPADPIEAQKVILALALAGLPVVHWNNLDEGELYGGGVMDAALTSTVWGDRILGESRDSGAVPLVSIHTLSGNNIAMRGDGDRRWIPTNLVTDLENPFERKDLKIADLRSHAIKVRPMIVRDILTIMRAHAVAGHPPHGQGPLGSFEVWDSIIRTAVWFATGKDCLETQRAARREKPDRLAKDALLQGWKEIDPNGCGLSAANAIKYASAQPEKYPILHTALLNLGRDGKLATVKALSKQLSAMKKSPINRMRFEDCGEDRNHTKLWKVVAY
jgi:hypothetical protein